MFRVTFLATDTAKKGRKGEENKQAEHCQLIVNHLRDADTRLRLNLTNTRHSFWKNRHTATPIRRQRPCDITTIQSKRNLEKPTHGNANPPTKAMRYNHYRVREIWKNRHTATPIRRQRPCDITTIQSQRNLEKPTQGIT